MGCNEWNQPTGMLYSLDLKRRTGSYMPFSYSASSPAQNVESYFKMLAETHPMPCFISIKQRLPLQGVTTNSDQSAVASPTLDLNQACNYWNSSSYRRPQIAQTYLCDPKKMGIFIPATYSKKSNLAFMRLEDGMMIG